MSFPVLCAVIAVVYTAGVLLVKLGGRRDDRAIGDAARESAARSRQRRAEIEAARAAKPASQTFGPLAAYGPLPKRPAPRRPAAPMPDPGDESAVLAAANLLIEEATRACRTDAEIQANAVLMADYAARHPLLLRPEPPDPSPVEPWQLNLPADAYPPHQVPSRLKSEASPSRLVERGASEHNPGGDHS